jgi:hypothetical protein
VTGWQSVPSSLIGGAPKLDVALPITSSGDGGLEELGADEFGTMFGDSGKDAEVATDEEIAAKTVTAENVVRLVQVASTVINAQGGLFFFS